MSCAECDQHLPHEAYYDGVDAYYCEGCMDKLIKDVSSEAETYAKEKCKITMPMPKYDVQ